MDCVTALYIEIVSFSEKKIYLRFYTLITFFFDLRWYIRGVHMISALLSFRGAKCELSWWCEVYDGRKSDETSRVTFRAESDCVCMTPEWNFVLEWKSICGLRCYCGVMLTNTDLKVETGMILHRDKKSRRYYAIRSLSDPYKLNKTENDRARADQ